MLFCLPPCPLDTLPAALPALLALLVLLAAAQRAMNATIDAVFVRVETAFTTLVDSIAAYNPSLQAAGDLIAADDDLARGMDQRALPVSPSTLFRLLTAQSPSTERIAPAFTPCAPREKPSKSSLDPR